MSFPLAYARGSGLRIPLVTRRSRWGSLAELCRSDGSLRQVRVLPPGTTAGGRRLLCLLDVAPALGAMIGLIVVALLGWTTSVGLAVAVAGGGIAAWVAARRATATLRAGIRSLSVTTWSGDSDAEERPDAASMAQCIALADRLDVPGLSPIEYEVLWAELYFALPARPAIVRKA